jgi:hypothetical protein
MCRRECLTGSLIRAFPARVQLIAQGIANGRFRPRLCENAKRNFSLCILCSK